MCIDVVDHASVPAAPIDAARKARRVTYPAVLAQKCISVVQYVGGLNLITTFFFFSYFISNIILLVFRRALIIREGTRIKQIIHGSHPKVSSDSI